MNTTSNNTFYESVETDNFRHRHSSSESSCNSSCCNYDSDYSIPEWDDSVQENGDLFYIKCSPIIQNLRLNDEDNSKDTTVTSKSNKLSTFLKKKRFKKHIKIVNATKPKRNINETTLKSDHSSICDFEGIIQSSVAVLFLNVTTIENTESNINENTLYCFPPATKENVINSIKGALLTLYHLLPKLVLEKPECSSIFVNDELVHLTYTGDENNVMIVAFPENKCPLFELKQWSTSLNCFLNFKYKSLHNCFGNISNHANLNQFFGNLFIKLLKNSVNLSTVNYLEIAENDESFQLLDSFIYPHQLSIPIVLEAKIHEKLNEIEANDFGDLSEDHYGCQRLYTLIGTCLYFQGHLIVTHLNREDQLDVHSFLRLNDILDLTITSTIESLIIWQEVYPTSCCSDVQNRSFMPNKRWFLLVIGKNQGLLVTLMETGGCSVSSVGPSRPDELYIEQIQEIMNDILHSGLVDVVEQLKKFSNIHSQKLSPRKSNENLSNTSNLVKRLNDCDTDINAQYHSNSLQTNGNSEPDVFFESVSRTTSSIFSDDVIPVLGRRAQRLKQFNNSGSIYSLSHSNLSDSDRSDYDTTSSSHSSSLMENAKKSSKDFGNVKRIIHGDEKALFYYVNLHPNKGIILYSMNTHHSELNRRHPSIMTNFISSVQKIHAILSQKKTSTLGKLHRNNVSVKEYGILFEHCDIEDDVKKNPPIIYWIIGRVFNKPYLGEVYVCYEDKTPQNLVEIAFRLAMSR